jgi:uncharacterized membrane protein YraQ (UPF0718 family)
LIRFLQAIGNKWVFLGISVVIYIVIGVFSPGLGLAAFWKFLDILITVVPVFLLVFGMMVLANMYLTSDRITSYLGEGSGFRGWVFAIGGGILSSGPIYMWYPLLSDLREKGMRDSLIAAFLYNRAVKIPLLPVMILYFGWVFTLVLSVLMIIFSVLNGLIVERFQEVRK